MAPEAKTTSTNPTISTALVKAILYQLWSAEVVASDKQEQRVEGELRGSEAEADSEEEYEEKGGSVKVSRRDLFATV